MPNFKFSILFLLLVSSLGLTGCGGSSVDDPLQNLGTNTASRVPHQSWGSYRLYNFVDGNWQLVVDLGQPVGAQPTLGERPVIILHGLGSNIAGGKFNDLATNLQSNGATSVFGFEYDSLDPISTNSTYFNLALAYLTTDEQNRLFRVAAHSMGGLVARSSFESGGSFAMQNTGNLVSFAAVPHMGSPIAEELAEGPSDVVEEALAQILLNGELTFLNADGSPVDVTGNEPSFAQLAPNSAFLNTLNSNADSTHPQFDYRTLAGNDRSDDFEAFNRILGVFADDGVVNVGSANSNGIGALSSETVPFDHTSIVEEQAPFLIIIRQLDLL